ncbi:hypothetical protein AM493_08860 [Flavobacterium akiainvivens]|uniref:Zinc finger CHC2-type domain-containing protein n=1 Tax=Flavobacterium akiainvivens TaxID=1202724 RepID=A0A0M9VI10_9FLAO|nr:toprim domain-containing protein [Flavobacterium akiainvivens]KOS06129.1 hypothetical protein AM493_08860 [Flavobacterium akiainvivens]SFQ67720.1 CHC2 zinc finger [Flavobacterium akiainvivens]
MNIEQANGIAMTEILRKLGYYPVREKGDELWYLSPLRDEKTASFKVHTGKNVWYDFGAGRGGDVIKFACNYLVSGNDGSAVSAALKWLQAFDTYTYTTVTYAKREPDPAERGFQVLKASELKYRILTNFIESRGIPLELAQEFLKEVLVRNNRTGWQFRAIGLYTEAEGFEIRTEDLKASVGAKSISFIRGTELPAKEIHVFEGMMDFLSAFAQHEKQHFEGDVIVLNSVSLAPQAVPYITNYRNYKKLTTWLDNDEAGRDATKYFKELAVNESIEFEAMNDLYAPYKDVNDWHVQTLKSKPPSTPKP